MKPNNYRRGLWAEQAAMLVLRLKGYRILAKRFKTPVGEVDIIAKRAKTLAFVEVKWRKRADDSAYAISAIALKRIARASSLYLKRRPDLAACTIRFDAILFCAYPVSKWIVHLKNVSM